MKKLAIFVAIVGLISTSCSKKETREEYKDNHDKTELRNELGDSAAAASPETTPVAEPLKPVPANTPATERDSVKSQVK